MPHKAATPRQLSMQLTAPSLEMLAEFYRCSTKTLQRLRVDGVDVTNALEVAAAIAAQRSATVPMLERVGELLDEIESPSAI